MSRLLETRTRSGTGTCTTRRRTPPVARRLAGAGAPLRRSSTDADRPKTADGPRTVGLAVDASAKLLQRRRSASSCPMLSFASCSNNALFPTACPPQGDSSRTGECALAGGGDRSGRPRRAHHGPSLSARPDGPQGRERVGHAHAARAFSAATRGAGPLAKRRNPCGRCGQAGRRIPPGRHPVGAVQSLSGCTVRGAAPARYPELCH